MKTAILINVRLDSKRLPKKHLIQYRNLTVLEILIKRIQYFFQNYILDKRLEIIIVTSLRIVNKQLEDIALRNGVEIFFGNDENIPYRQLRCAENFNLSNIINVCGDNILISMLAIETVYYRLCNGDNLVKTTGLPLGMNVAGYSYNKLQESLLNRIKENQRLDTGWYKIFEDMREIKISDYDLNSLRLTLDYKEDELFLISVFEKLGETLLTASDEDVLNTIKTYKLEKINNNLIEIYWKNFNANGENPNI